MLWITVRIKSQSRAAYGYGVSDGVGGQLQHSALPFAGNPPSLLGFSVGLRGVTVQAGCFERQHICLHWMQVQGEGGPHPRLLSPRIGQQIHVGNTQARGGDVPEPEIRDDGVLPKYDMRSMAACL